MNPFPWMRYFVNDFENDQHVAVMSTLALGAYHRLLWRAWHQSPVGTLPNDDVLLAQWARLTADEWAAVKPEVGPCFRLSRDARGTRWVQRRMVREYQAVATDKRQKSAAGRKAINARWGARKELDTTVLRSNNDRNTNTESDTEYNNNTAGEPPGDVVVVSPVAAEADPDPPPVPFDATAAALLRGAGVSDDVADDLARTVTSARAGEVIDLARGRVVAGKIKPDAMAGCIVAGLRENWVTGSPAAAAAQPPDERVRSARSASAKTAADREAEKGRLAAAERAAVDRIRALAPDRLATLKAEVLAGQPEMVRDRLAGADPIKSPMLRSLMVQRLAAG